MKQIKHPIASPRITAVNVNSGWDVATTSPLTPRRLRTWMVRVVWQEKSVLPEPGGEIHGGLTSA